MGRQHFQIMKLVLIAALAGLGLQTPKPKEDSVEFRWLETTGETYGVRYSTHQLRSLPAVIRSGPEVEIEQEKKQIDAQTTSVTKRVYNKSLNGERRLVETVAEEIKKDSSGSFSAVRTTLRPDANGRMVAVQKETQVIAPAGGDTYRVTKSTSLPGLSGRLAEKERVEQTEKRSGAGAVEIDRTQYQQSVDGKWNITERRISQNQSQKDQLQTDEQVYHYDANKRLLLVQQLKIAESQDASGKRRRETVSYAAGIDGKMQLDSRSTVIRTTDTNQKQETTEILEEKSRTAPGEGLMLTRKIVEISQPVGENQTESRVEVHEPDINGRMRNVHIQEAIENK